MVDRTEKLFFPQIKYCEACSTNEAAEFLEKISRDDFVLDLSDEKAMAEFDKFLNLSKDLE